MSTEGHWGILPIGSDVCLPLRTIYVREVFVILLQNCDSSVFWCVNVYSIYVIGVLVAFIK